MQVEHTNLSHSFIRVSHEQGPPHSIKDSNLEGKGGQKERLNDGPSCVSGRLSFSTDDQCLWGQGKHREDVSLLGHMCLENS